MCDSACGSACMCSACQGLRGCKHMTLQCLQNESECKCECVRYNRENHRAVNSDMDSCNSRSAQRKHRHNAPPCNRASCSRNRCSMRAPKRQRRAEARDPWLGQVGLGLPSWRSSGSWTQCHNPRKMHACVRACVCAHVCACACQCEGASHVPFTRARVPRAQMCCKELVGKQSRKTRNNHKCSSSAGGSIGGDGCASGG